MMLRDSMAIAAVAVVDNLRVCSEALRLGDDICYEG